MPYYLYEAMVTVLAHDGNFTIDKHLPIGAEQDLVSNMFSRYSSLSTRAKQEETGLKSERICLTNVGMRQ